MSVITVLPGVYYNEKVDNINYGGNGEIPCFIGKTNNKGTDTAQIQGKSAERHPELSTVISDVACFDKKKSARFFTPSERGQP